MLSALSSSSLAAAANSAELMADILDDEVNEACTEPCNKYKNMTWINAQEMIHVNNNDGSGTSKQLQRVFTTISRLPHHDRVVIHRLSSSNVTIFTTVNWYFPLLYFPLPQPQTVHLLFPFLHFCINGGKILGQINDQK